MSNWNWLIKPEKPYTWGFALRVVIKALVCLLLIAPLAIPMGMPFPLGLAELNTRAPGLIPWAWGINGCATVISQSA